MRILHLADLHLGLSLSQFGVEGAALIREEIEASLKRLKESLGTGYYDGLIFAGDIFEDSEVGSYYLMLVAGLFKALLDKGGFVCYASGNHDSWVSEKHLASLRAYEKFCPFLGSEFRTYRFEQDGVGVVVHGLGYDEIHPAREVSHLYPAKEPDSKDVVIGVFHGDVKGSEKTNFYYTVDLTKIALKNYNYFAMGHVHRPSVYHGSIAYPGTPFPQGFDETEPGNINEVLIEGSHTKVVPKSSVNYSILNIRASIEAYSREEVLAKAVQILEEHIKSHSSTHIIKFSLEIRGPRRLFKELDDSLEEDIFLCYAGIGSRLITSYIVEEDEEDKELNPELLSVLDEALLRFRRDEAETTVEARFSPSFELKDMLETEDIRESIIADLEADYDN